MWGVGEEDVGMRGTRCVMYIYEIVKEKINFFPQGNKINLSGEGISRPCRIQLGWFVVSRGRMKQN